MPRALAKVVAAREAEATQETPGNPNEAAAGAGETLAPSASHPKLMSDASQAKLQKHAKAINRVFTVNRESESIYAGVAADLDTRSVEGGSLLDRFLRRFKRLRVVNDPHRSLFLLGQENRLRRFLYVVMESRYYSWLALLVTLLNFAFVGLRDPKCDTSDCTSRLQRYINQMVDIAEFPLAVFYTVEMILFIIAKGLVLHRGSYLRSPMHLLDVVVVGFAWLATTPANNFTTMRAFAIIRFLKVFAGTRLLVDTVATALPLFLQVCLQLFFFLIVFGILGVQLFEGKLRYRFLDSLTGLPGLGEDVNYPSRMCDATDTISGIPSYYCALFSTESLARLVTADTAPGPLGEPPYFSNITQGYTNFDNIFFAFLAIFQCFTLSQWSNYMYYLEDAADPITSVTYFICLTLSGGLLVQNLLLAVINAKYADAQAREQKRREERRVAKAAVERAKDRGNKRAGIKKKRRHREGLLVRLTRVAARIFPNLEAVADRMAEKAAEKADAALRAKAEKGGRLAVGVSLSVLAAEAGLDNLHDGEYLSSEAAATKAGRACCGGLFPKLRRFRTRCQAIVKSIPFFFAQVSLIVGAFVVAGLYRYNENPNLDSTLKKLDAANVGITAGFLIEAVLKLIARGPFSYFTTGSTLFEATCVALAVVQALLVDDGPGRSGPLYTVRLLRIFQVAGHGPWRRLRLLVRNTGSSLRACLSFIPVYALCCIIVALLGMQLFGGLLSNWDGTEVRSNFDTVYSAYLTVFQITTGDNWNDIMFNAMRGCTQASGPVLSYLVPWFFVAVYVGGNFIIINVFLSIVIFDLGERKRIGLYGGENDEAPAWRWLAAIPSRVADRLRDRFSPPMLDDEGNPIPAEATRGRLEMVGKHSAVPVQEPVLPRPAALADSVAAFKATKHAAISQAQRVQAERDAANREGTPGEDAGRPGSAPEEEEEGQEGAKRVHLRDLKGSRMSISQIWTKTGVTAGEKRGMPARQRSLERRGSFASRLADEDEAASMAVPSGLDKDWQVTDVELFSQAANAAAAGPSGRGGRVWRGQESGLKRARRVARTIVQHRGFTYVVLVLITFQCIILAFWNPFIPPARQALFRSGDLLLLVLFTLELAIRAFAFGLWAEGPHAFFRDGWNIFDTVIVMASWLGTMLEAVGDVKYLKVFSAARAFRPLRLIRQIPGMKVVVETLVRVVPSIGSVTVLGLLIWLVFAILAVQLFAGKFFTCTDPYKLTKADCKDFFTDEITGIYQPRLWVNSEQNFDNLAAAMLRLYEISTLESWTAYMFEAMDTVGIDKAMRTNANAAAAMYFHAFVIIGTFFVLNMFISEVVDCFRTTKDLEELGRESAFMTPSQKQWRSALSYALRVGLRKRVTPPPPGFRLKVYRMINTSRFEGIVAALIIGSIVAQLLWFYDAPAAWTAGLSAANAFFVVVFALEAAVKIVAFGPRSYFTDYWHLFDFLVALLSVLSLGLDSVGNVGRVKAVRAFRVIRVFRLFTRFESLKVLLNTFVLCLPALLNVGAVLVTALFVFAILGVTMFGKVKLRGDLNEYANFRTVATAMVSLFRFSTGENWNNIMHDCMVTTDCTPGEDCGTAYAPVYFIAFTTLSQSILLQLLLSVVLESYAHNSSQSSLQISTRHINDFVRVWERMDRDATEFLHIDSQLPAFLRRLGPPLGLSRSSTNVEVVKRICALDMPVFPGNRVHFYEVLRACVDLVYKDSGAFLPIKVRRQIHREGIRAFGRMHVPAGDTAALSAATYYAAKVVQRRWREVIARRRAEGHVPAPRRRPSLADPGSPRGPLPLPAPPAPALPPPKKKVEEDEEDVEVKSDTGSSYSEPLAGRKSLQLESVREFEEGARAPERPAPPARRLPPKASAAAAAERAAADLPGRPAGEEAPPPAAKRAPPKPARPGQASLSPTASWARMPVPAAGPAPALPAAGRGAPPVALYPPSLALGGYGYGYPFALGVPYPAAGGYSPSPLLGAPVQPSPIPPLVGGRSPVPPFPGAYPPLGP